MATSSLQHGARSKLYINGVLYGVATSFSYQVNYGRKAISGIDVPVPLELGATTIEITGTINILKIANDQGIQGYGLGPQQQNFSLEQYVTILMIDRVTNNAVFRTNQAQVLSESWDMPNKGLVTGSISFKCITSENESSQ